MSVGKASIKRAAGAGTKKTAKATVKKIVEAEAVVPAVEETAEAVAAEEAPVSQKPARKRTAAKKTSTKKSTEKKVEEKTADVKAEVIDVPAEEKKAKAQFVRLKEELPVYLL